MPYHKLQRKEVMNLLGLTPKTATKYIRQCRDALGKAPHQILTMREFCDYYDIQHTD